MKIISLKSVLMISGLVWVLLSFYWFVNRTTQDSAIQLAEANIQSAYTEALQKSDDLRFKLGQWAYNYHLVKTKGVDFDQDGFLASEFDDMYFFKLEDADLKTQWIKSKDMTTAVVPAGLSTKLKQWSKEDLLKKEFIVFTEKVKSKGAKVFFGFPVVDPVMGEGVILSSLDQDYVQLISPHLNVYLLDSKGRFLYHPQKEYIGQSAGRLTQVEGKDLVLKTASAGSIDGELVYRKKIDGVWAQTLWPTLVMFFGLLLTFGVIIFEMLMQAPLNIGSGLTMSQASASTSEKDDYGTILKLNEVRELLNKMSLTSSVLKGRLDLASNGELDQRLFENIKVDFDVLDQTIEQAYRTSQTFEPEAQTKKSEDVSQDMTEESSAELTSADNGVVISMVSGHQIASATQDQTSGLSSLTEAAKVLQEQGLDLDNEEPDDVFGDFQDSAFDTLSFDTDLTNIEETQSDETWGDLLDFKDEDDVAEGVVFQEYIGTENEVNDWAKIIEELTEEINTVEFKPTALNKDQNPGG